MAEFTPEALFRNDTASRITDVGWTRSSQPVDAIKRQAAAADLWLELTGRSEGHVESEHDDPEPEYDDKEASFSKVASTALGPATTFHKTPEVVVSHHLKKHAPKLLGAAVAGAGVLKHLHGIRRDKKLPEEDRTKRKLTLTGRQRAAAGAALGSIAGGEVSRRVGRGVIKDPLGGGALRRFVGGGVGAAAGAGSGADRGHKLRAGAAANTGHYAGTVIGHLAAAGMLAGAMHQKRKITQNMHPELQKHIFSSELETHMRRGTFRPLVVGAGALGAAVGAHLGHGKPKDVQTNISTADLSKALRNASEDKDFQKMQKRHKKSSRRATLATVGTVVPAVAAGHVIGRHLDSKQGPFAKDLGELARKGRAAGGLAGLIGSSVLTRGRHEELEREQKERSKLLKRKGFTRDTPQSRYLRMSPEAQSKYLRKK